MRMVGIVIGSGIYFTTGIMAQNLPSAGFILLVWIAGGLITLAGRGFTLIGIPVYYYWKRRYNLRK